MIDDRKYIKNGYQISVPKCRITEDSKRKSCFIDQNQICTIERSLGNFKRVSEEIKIKKIKKVV